MPKSRLEAFSYGVIAIVITIMVLELKIPHGTEWQDFRPLLPILGTYVLSFTFVAIYWNNHHHLLHTVRQVSARILWSNLHLLFWLSLVPFVTGWMGENHFAAWPVALYGVVLLMAGIAYFILTRAIIRHHGQDSTLAAAVGRDLKGWASIVACGAAIPMSLLNRWVAVGLYVVVALMWFIPDRRIEKTLGEPRS